MVACQDRILGLKYIRPPGHYQLPIWLQGQRHGPVTGTKVRGHRSPAPEGGIELAIGEVAYQQYIGRPARQGDGNAGYHQFAIGLLDQGIRPAATANGGSDFSSWAKGSIHAAVRMIAHKQDVVDTIT